MSTQRAPNFYAQFAAAAERFPDRTAVEMQRRDAIEAYSYAQLRSMAEQVAGFLARRDAAGIPRLNRGERAAILGDNDARWCAAYLGVLRVGGIAVPLDTAYHARQVATLLRDCGAKILCVAPRYLEAARAAAGACEHPPEIVLLHRPPPGSADAAAAGLASLDDPREGAAPPLPPSSATAEDPAVILYTSGTTSDPKGVVLTHGNLLAELASVFEIIHVDDRDAILGVLPLFHALAQLANLLLPFSVGARVVFLETLNSTELLRALAERNITAFCCVPQFFYLIHQRVREQAAAARLPNRLALHALLAINGRLRDLAGTNLGPVFFRPVHRLLGRKMRLLVTGGSRFDPVVARDLYRLGFDLLQAYGLTESCGAATLTRPRDKFTTSAGTPLPGVEVRTARSAAEPLQSEAQDGEILIRGPIVMQSYFNRPEATTEALAGGWLHTGDLGYFDAAGQLHITGRKKEVIVLSSGKNIYPEEIEAHYAQSPFIKELCVLGLARADEPAAERLHAVVVPEVETLRQHRVLNVRDVLRFEIEGLSVRLPSHKRILSYEIWTRDLPRTTTRKLRRFAIEKEIRGRPAAQGAPGEQIAEAPPRELSAEEAAWASRPEVTRALELVREAAKDPGKVRPEANLELDLGLDSIERVELLAQLQREFGSVVPDEVAHRIYTARELVEAVVLRATAGAGPSPAPDSPTGACSREGRPQGVDHAPEPPARGDAWGVLLERATENDAEFAELLRPTPLFTAAVFAAIKVWYAFAWLALRFRVCGRENLPARGPCLLCPNHQSYLDPFLVVSALPFHVFRKLFFVGASEYFATPLRRWLARKLNVFPVDPDTNLLRAMQAGAFGLRHRKILVLFPEGERSIDGTVRYFKKGAAILSQHLRAPIVPVALDGVFDVWPRERAPRWGALLPGDPGRILMRIGAALPPPEPLPAGLPAAQTESHYAAVAERLRRTVLEMWQSLGRPAVQR